MVYDAMTFDPNARGSAMRNRYLIALRSVIAIPQVMLVGVIAAAPVHSQTPDADDTTSTLTYCRRSEAALSRRPTGPQYGQALAGLQSCGEVGARALVAEWRRPPSDSARLQELAATSSAVRDRRIADVTRGIVTQPSRPREERLAALAALVAQAAPENRVVYLDTSKPALPGTSPVMLTELVHGPSSTAKQAHSPSPAEVLALVRQLASSDPDPIVKGIAAHLAEQLDRKVN